MLTLSRFFSAMIPGGAGILRYSFDIQSFELGHFDRLSIDKSIDNFAVLAAKPADSNQSPGKPFLTPAICRFGLLWSSNSALDIRLRTQLLDFNLCGRSGFGRFDVQIEFWHGADMNPGLSRGVTKQHPGASVEKIRLERLASPFFPRICCGFSHSNV